MGQIGRVLKFGFPTRLVCVLRTCQPGRVQYFGVLNLDGFMHGGDGSLIFFFNLLSIILRAEFEDVL